MSTRAALLCSLALLASCTHTRPAFNTYKAASGFEVHESFTNPARASCASDATVTVSVTISLPDSTIIDTTRDADPATLAEHAIVRDGPMTFSLTEVPPGVRELIAGMRRDQWRRATIPASLLYGAAGRPPRIPPNTPLTYDVTLINFTNP